MIVHQGRPHGPDGVPINIYKSEINLCSPLLTNVLNSINAVGFISTWPEAIVVPIFKKGNRNDPACYRPISLLDALMKVAGRIILNRIKGWAEDNNVITSLQYGFRPGKGTIEQSLNLSLLIAKYTQAKNESLHVTS